MRMPHTLNTPRKPQRQASPPPHSPSYTATVESAITPRTVTPTPKEQCNHELRSATLVHMSLIAKLTSRFTQRAPQSQPPQDASSPGTPYPHILRRATTRWWKAPAAIATTIGGAVLAIAAMRLSLPLLGGGVDSNNPTPSPAASAALNLALASLIPISIGAVALVYRVSGGYLHSITGRVRWKWLATAVAATLPIWLLGNLAQVILSGESSFAFSQGWFFHLAIALLLTPLQAAGEEYIVRGLLLTTIASWFRDVKVGFCVAGAISTIVFTALHTSAHPWIVLNLAGMSLMSLYLVWRTGGLEASIAIHVANNLTLGVIAVFTASVGEGQITETSEISLAASLYSLALVGIGIFVLNRLFSREGLSSTTQNQPEPVER